MFRFLQITSLSLALLTFFSCHKPTKANWDVNGTVPLINSRLSIQNFIGDSLFSADNTGLLSINATRTVTSIELDSLISLPDTTIVQSYTIPAVFPTKLAPGQPLSFFPATELTFSIGNGVALKRIDIRHGSLDVKFSNTITQPLDMYYVITDAVKNGQPLIISETIPPGTHSLIKSYDLSGYTLNMRGLSGNIYNTIVQSCTISINPHADTALVTYGQGAMAEISYQNLTPQYAEGYFGQQVIPVPLDTARLNIFNNIHASNFLLSDASLNFKILNGFGAEFTGSFANIKSINSYAGNSVALGTTQLANININRATQAAGQVYPSIKNIPFNSTNSNIVPFLSNLPDKLSYQGNVHLNPLGNISGYNDFAYYGHGIQVLAEINIPLSFNADNFKLSTNASVDFSNVSQLEHVRSGNFVIQAHNGYPFRVMLQAYLLDAHRHIIDSLFIPHQNVIQGGQLNSQNDVIAPSFSKLSIPITLDKIVKMRRSKSIQVVTYFIMPPNPPSIRFYENYEIDLNVVAELIYNVVD